MKDENWNSSLLTEIAGEEWRDEPELVGAVGSAGDLLGDVRFHPDLAEQLSAEQIEHVRTEMAGIREALIDIWKALDRVSPGSTCLGTLCVNREHLDDDDEAAGPVGEPVLAPRPASVEDHFRSMVERHHHVQAGPLAGHGTRDLLRAVPVAVAIQAHFSDATSRGLSEIADVLPRPEKLMATTGVIDPQVIEAAYALWDLLVDEAIDDRPAAKA